MVALPERGWLIGDSGYPLKEWLLTPFLSPSNQQEEKYNDALTKTRIVVERAFGVLKSRFRCLHASGALSCFHPVNVLKLLKHAVDCTTQQLMLMCHLDTKELFKT
ncbi:putative nuclease HARBI1 [Saccostrea cucullata]|uniref:putative nuclease HARBI1 n=1 Tax=Saccostrea cuccullata TaxID=36930 RepID=UPI002ED0BA7C